MEDNKLIFVPVVDKVGNPLMSTTPARAKKWIKSRKATPFWKKGIFCVRLNVDPSGQHLQQIAVGIDPGSKKEGFTVKSTAHTFLNINVDAVTWVKDAVEVKRNMRRSRRYRKTPCRKSRINNKCKRKIPPSTRARWDWKLRICKLLTLLFPVTDFIVEDMKTVTRKGGRRWNLSFSPLATGKTWFYEQLRFLGRLSLKQGHETAKLRKALGLTKSLNKMKEIFNTHAVDSWVLANSIVGGHTAPDNIKLLCLTPIQLHRRQLHALQPSKSGFRRCYSSTRSMGFKRGALVKHTKYGLAYIGGTSFLEGRRQRISLHAINSGKRLTTNIKPEDCRLLSFNGVKYHYA